MKQRIPTCLVMLLAIGVSFAADTCDHHEAVDAGPSEGLHLYAFLGGALLEPPDSAITNRIDGAFIPGEGGKWVAAPDTPFIRGFVQGLREAEPGRRLGLLFTGDGTSRIEDWHTKSRSYRQTRGAIKAARSAGVLKGVAWHHAPSFSILPLNELKTLVAYLRVDTASLNLPFVVGDVPGHRAMNQQLAALAEEVHAVAVASAEGITLGGGSSLDAAGREAFGRHYAEQMLAVRTHWEARGDRPAPSDIGIVDPHVHAFANKEGGFDALIPWMERNHIEQVLVSPIGHSRATTDTQRAIRDANFARHRGRIHRFCLIEPGEVGTVEEAVATLQREKANGAVAFGEHYGRNRMFDDPENLLLYAACEKVGLPVLFHIDQNKNMDEQGLPRVERVLKDYPDCQLIAHAWWWLHFPEGTCDRQLRDYPNLYADISGRGMAAMLNRDRGTTRAFLIRHQDRILFGSDAGWWSFGDEEARELQFRVLEELDLPDPVRRKIYRENALRLFGLVPGS